MTDLHSYALRLAREAKASGEILDFDVNPSNGVITAQTDQGWCVWLSADDMADEEA